MLSQSILLNNLVTDRYLSTFIPLAPHLVVNLVLNMFLQSVSTSFGVCVCMGVYVCMCVYVCVSVSVSACVYKLFHWSMCRVIVNPWCHLESLCKTYMADV